MLKDDSPNAPADPALPFTVGAGEPVILKPESHMMTAAVCIGGFLIPGLGHLILRRWIRGGLLLVSVMLMFALGLQMQGALTPPPDASEWLSFKTLNAFANVGVGLPYAIAMRLNWGEGVPTSQSADYGWLFLVVAGLLNYLIVLDAFDLARGRKP